MVSVITLATSPATLSRVVFEVERILMTCRSRYLLDPAGWWTEEMEESVHDQDQALNALLRGQVVVSDEPAADAAALTAGATTAATTATAATAASAATAL